MSAVTIPARVPQLIRMLGTDKDGERLAAVAALDRTLKAAGLDWHALADRVERGPEFVYQTVYRDPPKPEEPNWIHITEFCVARVGLLSEREAAFVLDMSVKVYRWPPSDKQARWLSSIYSRLKAMENWP